MAVALAGPEISMTTAFGFSLLASMFTSPPITDTKDKGWWDLVAMSIGQFVVYGLTLVAGWFVHTPA